MSDIFPSSSFVDTLVVPNPPIIAIIEKEADITAETPAVEYSTAGVSAVISASFSIIAIIGGLGTTNVSTKDEDGKISLIAGEDTITVKNNRSTKISYQLFQMI